MQGLRVSVATAVAVAVCVGVVFEQWKTRARLVHLETRLNRHQAPAITVEHADGTREERKLPDIVLEQLNDIELRLARLKTLTSEDSEKLPADLKLRLFKLEASMEWIKPVVRALENYVQMIDGTHQYLIMSLREFGQEERATALEEHWWDEKGVPEATRKLRREIREKAEALGKANRP
jgi:hypothetical protein